MELEKIHTCRLCFSSGNYQINIFNGLEFNKYVAKVITEHIGQISETDSLPKSVCIDCWNKLEDFHKFHRFVQSSQIQYLKNIGKHEQADKQMADKSHPKPFNFANVLENFTDGRFYAEVTSELKSGLEAGLFGQGTSDQNNAYKHWQNNIREDHAKGNDKHHMNHRPNSEMCEFCAKVFGSRNDLLLHIQKMHTKTGEIREKFQCEVCFAWLASRHTLKTHMLNHTSEPKKCPYCEKISPTRNALTIHIRGVHTERSHKCHLCEKAFKAATALKDHIATHTREKMYNCSFCSESFIWRSNMYSHQKRAHPTEWSESKRQRDAMAKYKL